MKIFFWTFFPLSIGMPPTSTETQLPMLITRNIKLSKLKIISSPSTRYYTTSQPQTHEKKSGSRKCTTALVSYKITSRSDWQWSTRSGSSYHRRPTAGFYVSVSVLGRVSAAKTDRMYSLLNENYTLLGTPWHRAPKHVIKKSCLCIVALWHISCQDHSRSKIKWQLDLIN